MGPVVDLKYLVYGLMALFIYPAPRNGNCTDRPSTYSTAQLLSTTNICIKESIGGSCSDKCTRGIHNSKCIPISSVYCYFKINGGSSDARNLYANTIETPDAHGI